MTTTAATLAEPTYYEVVWGCDENDRTVRIDYHDGSPLSRNAEAHAALVFFNWNGPVGLFRDGELIAGERHECEKCVPPVEHKTLTAERAEGERYVTRSNGSCGRWVRDVTTIWQCTCGSGGFGRNNDRADARAAARRHREDPAGFPGTPGLWIRLAGLPAGGEGQ